MIRLMGFTRCSGLRATTIWMVEQLGLAMMPWWRRMSSGLTSGTTSGTWGSIRKAEVLSITTAPAWAATGEKRLLTLPPGDERTTSMFSKE